MQLVHFEILFAILFAVLFLVAGTIDFNSAKQEEAVYCQNVKEKIHPDYKNIYKKVCVAVDTKTKPN